MSYMFNENFNNDAFFWWEKNLIKHLHWSALSQASKAVFPVIACHANKSGISYPSEDTISALSGITPKTVRHGINGLKYFCGIEWEKYLTARGRYSKKIKMELPKTNDKNCFPFFRVVLENGKWHELTPAGKALYPVMRCFSSFSYEEYAQENDEELASVFEDYFQRKYEKCNAHKSVLAEHAGISRRHVNSALESLKKCGLIEWDDIDAWKVFLRSDGYYFKREVLNKKVIEMRRTHAGRG